MSNHPAVRLNDGRAMPQLGLGVWQTPAGDAAKVVATALQTGYRAVDTAAIYANEDGVGAGLKVAGVARDALFITTKLWNEDQGYDNALKAFDISARKLGLAAVDLYLIHWPSPHRGRYVESWKALVRLQIEGRARSIGVSNFEEEHLDRVIGETGVTPAVNQIELHPRFQQHALREIHARLGIATQSWSPLGQGKLLDNPQIAKVAAKHGKSPAQVIIRWHLDSGLIVIPKSVTASRIRDNIDVFDFQLDGEDLQTIAALDDLEGRIGPDPHTATL